MYFAEMFPKHHITGPGLLVGVVIVIILFWPTNKRKK